VLWGCLRAVGRPPSPRKLRLISCGVARTAFDWCRNFWFREAVAAGEAWADGRPAVGEIRVRLEALRSPWGDWEKHEWISVGLWCVGENPRPEVAERAPGTVQAVAAVYRDLFENPFVPVEWRPDWRTSTARDLARTIYDRHAFDLMPILADALLDAGCDHQLVQDHCRSGKPHARGCWVLDALLGLA
jgi:hypothetical protein